MLVLINQNNVLYVQVLMELRREVMYQGKKFNKGLQKDILLLPEEVEHLLTLNASIKLWNGDKYIKLNLGQFYDVMKNRSYSVKIEQPKIQHKVDEKVVKVETVVEPVKQQPKVEVKPETKVEQPKEEKKQETKVEQPKVEVKPETKVEQPKEEKKQENKNYENKKQRHNNNNNKQQGGDK